jgi:hypothetical protein
MLVTDLFYNNFCYKCPPIGNDSKKSLKIPKGQSEYVYQRTDNTMAKRKSTKGK